MQVMNLFHLFPVSWKGKVHMARIWEIGQREALTAWLCVFLGFHCIGDLGAEEEPHYSANE